MTEERRVKVRRRAAWVANRFVLARRNAGTLFCDECGFDPAERLKGTSVSPRSVLDAHHRTPLEEGSAVRG